MLVSRGRRARFAGATCLGLTLALALSACGGSSGNQAVQANPEQASAAPAAAAPAAPAADAPAATAPKAAAPAVAAPGAAAPVAAPGAAAPAAPDAGKAKAAPAKTKTKTKTTTDTAKAPAAGPGAGAGAGGANAPCKAALAPIVLGQVGTFSGLMGQSIGGMKPGVQLWAQDVNARGGVQCHPIQLIQVDDQNDPQKAAASTEDLIVNKKVVAFVGGNSPISFPGIVRTLDKYKIPLIGGDGIDRTWQLNQYWFPQGGSPLAAFAGAVAHAKQALGFTKTFLLYCAEGAICLDTNKSSKAKGGMMDAAGVTLVGAQQVTLTQPDYTASCQLAKNAGAQFLFVLVDAASMRRLARSCASIGYKVPIAGTAIDFTATSPKDTNLSSVGVYAAAPVAPFPATDIPAMKTFHAAFDKYLPGQSPDQSVVEGWTSGKLFEQAVANVADKARAGNVTTEMIYDGLYKMKNETLDGLVPGATFNRGSHATVKPCYFNLKIKDGQYLAPYGSKVSCLPFDPTAG
jgi:branched-chain amino acid transport system substrate-binding protein